MADFSLQVQAWADKTAADNTALLRGVCMALMTRVKELSPVDTGYFRSCWIDAVNGATVTLGDTGNTPGAAIAMAVAGDTVSIVNPVTYGRRLEYGFVGTDSLGRSYHQEPRGFVAQTVAEYPSIVAQVMAGLSK
jgi:hypothetical protein